MTEQSSTRPLTVEEAAEYLDLSTSYIYKLVSAGEIPYFKSRGGKRTYFALKDLQSWAFGRRVSSAEEIDQRAIEYVGA